MAIFCDELGVNLWEAIEAASTKPFGFQKFLPGPGVGGHCIPVDPSYLSFTVRRLGYPFRFVELAQEINERMPAYVVNRVQRLLNRHRKAVNGSKVLLLGVTYKPDIADERETPAVPIARGLLDLGAELAYLDPHVPVWSVDGVPVRNGGDLETAVHERRRDRAATATFRVRPRRRGGEGRARPGHPRRTGRERARGTAVGGTAACTCSS